MMRRVNVIEIDDYDRNLLIRALNDLRTSLIEKGRDTAAVDDLMIKIYESRSRKAKVAEERSADVYR